MIVEIGPEMFVGAQRVLAVFHYETLMYARVSRACLQKAKEQKKLISVCGAGAPRSVVLFTQENGAHLFCVSPVAPATLSMRIARARQYAEGKERTEI